MELAQALCADDEQDEWEVLEQLASLVEKSLVVAERGKRFGTACSNRHARFRSSNSQPSGETRSGAEGGTQWRCCSSCSALTTATWTARCVTDEYAALVLPELDNLRSAYAWAAGEEGDRAIAIGLAAHAGALIDYSMEFVEWLLEQRATCGRE